jgi:hypothetical protein
MPKPIRRCLRCRAILPPWARIDTRFCGGSCRQAAFREQHRWRRRKPCAEVQAAGPIKVRDRQVQINDIEGLIAQTEAAERKAIAAIERVLKMKPSAPTV